MDGHSGTQSLQVIRVTWNRCETCGAPGPALMSMESNDRKLIMSLRPQCCGFVGSSRIDAEAPPEQCQEAGLRSALRSCQSGPDNARTVLENGWE